MKKPYFAYGSNMNLAQMAKRCPGARLLGLARLRGWRFLINSRGYATAREESGAEIFGGLWELTEEHGRTLDRYEGVAAGYYERVDFLVSVWPEGEDADVFAYLATDDLPGVPSARYHQAVVNGAREIGLAEEYLAELEAWRAGPPADLK